jgi:hypothetical protein
MAYQTHLELRQVGPLRSFEILPADRTNPKRLVLIFEGEPINYEVLRNVLEPVCGNFMDAAMTYISKLNAMNLLMATEESTQRDISSRASAVARGEL